MNNLLTRVGAYSSTYWNSHRINSHGDTSIFFSKKNVKLKPYLVEVVGIHGHIPVTSVSDSVCQNQKLVKNFEHGSLCIVSCHLKFKKFAPAAAGLSLIAFLFVLLSPSQIIRYSKNFEESNHLKFDQNYIIR